MKSLATVFKALGDETRLRMLALLLARGEVCVCDYEHVLGVLQSKASRHMRYLYHAGLVQDRRAAVWIYYRIVDEPSAEVKIVLDAARKLLGGREVDGLVRRLDARREGRDKAGGVCAVPPPRKRARSSSRSKPTTRRK